MNLTLSVDERLVKEARRAARAMGKSLNQLVRDYLEQFTARDDPRRDIDEIQRLEIQPGRAPWPRVASSTAKKPSAGSCTSWQTRTSRSTSSRTTAAETMSSCSS
jgi:hypothetical protein